MKIENAELKHIERIVAISKAAFDSDIHVGASEAAAPPDYDSIPWHIQMKNEGHLLQAVIAGEIVGGAILFLDKDRETLYIGRIFIDPVHHRKGYGLCQSENGIVNWGHCGISLGEGQVIHAWATVRIDDFLQIEQLASPIGEHPCYIGWVPLERVLNHKSDR